MSRSCRCGNRLAISYRRKLIIIVIVVIIIIIISFMQDIRTYMPETNPVSRVHSVAAIPCVLLIVHIIIIIIIIIITTDSALICDIFKLTYLPFHLIGVLHQYLYITYLPQYWFRFVCLVFCFCVFVLFCVIFVFSCWLCNWHLCC
jgi:hypothetical protein